MVHCLWWWIQYEWDVFSSILNSLLEFVHSCKVSTKQVEFQVSKSGVQSHHSNENRTKFPITSFPTLLGYCLLLYLPATGFLSLLCYFPLFLLLLLCIPLPTVTHCLCCHYFFFSVPLPILTHCFCCHYIFFSFP